MFAHTGYAGIGFRGLGDLSPSGDTYVNDIGTSASGDTIVDSPASTGYVGTPDSYAGMMNAIQNLINPISNTGSGTGITLSPIIIVVGIVLLAAVFGSGGSSRRR